MALRSLWRRIASNIAKLLGCSERMIDKERRPKPTPPDTGIKSPDADEAPGLLRGKREDTSSPRASLVRIDSPRASSVTYATPTEADARVASATRLLFAREIEVAFDG